MYQEIQEWLTRELGHLSADHPVSIHLDDLLNKNIGKDAMVNVAIKAFLTLVEQLKGKQSLAVPLLVIPLRTIGAQLTKEVPRDLATLIRQLDDEPPSLYLLHPDIILKHPEFCEEYKCPLFFELVASPTYNFYAYYREFRCAEALNKRWEFSRAIYVQLDPLY